MHEPSGTMSPERCKEMNFDLGFSAAGFGNYLKYKQRHRSEAHLPALFD